MFLFHYFSGVGWFRVFCGVFWVNFKYIIAAIFV